MNYKCNNRMWKEHGPYKGPRKKAIYCGGGRIGGHRGRVAEH